MASRKAIIWVSVGVLVGASWLLALALAVNFHGALGFATRHGLIVLAAISAVFFATWLPALAAVRLGRYPRGHFVARTAANMLLVLLLAGLLVLNWPPDLLIVLSFATAGAFGVRVVAAWTAARSVRR